MPTHFKIPLFIAVFIFAVLICISLFSGVFDWQYGDKLDAWLQLRLADAKIVDLLWFVIINRLLDNRGK